MKTTCTTKKTTSRTNERSISMGFDVLSETIASRFQSQTKQKYGNSSPSNNSENGSSGVKIKRSCESLGVCQGDGRCDDCPPIA